MMSFLLYRSSLMDFAIVSVRPCSRSCRTRNMRNVFTLCLQAPFRRRVQLAGSTASTFSMSHEAHEAQVLHGFLQPVSSDSLQYP
ncbi:unnamed protein product [Sphagnum balticum]